jgi:elongation factor G
VAEYPVVGTKIVLEDGTYHDVDSSEKAFYTAAQGCFREYFKQAGPKLLEPIMNVEIECPETFQGPVVGDVTKRRGVMSASDVLNGSCVIQAEVPLAETFGYATDLRSMTQGQGTFSMELATFRQVPSNIQEEIIAKKQQELAEAK